MTSCLVWELILPYFSHEPFVGALLLVNKRSHLAILKHHVGMQCRTTLLGPPCELQIDMQHRVNRKHEEGFLLSDLTFEHGRDYVSIGLQGNIHRNIFEVAHLATTIAKCCRGLGNHELTMQIRNCLEFPPEAHALARRGWQIVEGFHFFMGEKVVVLTYGPVSLEHCIRKKQVASFHDATHHWYQS